MKPIPEANNALVLRTDFSDDAAWESVCAAIREPVQVYHDGNVDVRFQANVEPVSDPEYDGLTVERLRPLLPQDLNHTFMFIVDHTMLSHPEQPILVIDLYMEPGRTFRVIPSEMWGVENNLSIANMDFAEFAAAVDEDGIFRGFPTG